MKLRNFIHTAVLSLGAVLLLAGTAIGGFLIYFNGLHPVVQAELGCGLPAAESFLDGGGEAAYADPISEISLTEEGNYRLRIETEHGKRSVSLRVRDTQAPAAEGTTVLLTTDETCLPEEAVISGFEASGWSAEWTQQPGFGTEGRYETGVLLTDACGNSAEYPVTVIIGRLTEEISAEAGTAIPAASQFFSAPEEETEYIAEQPALVPAEPGTYELTVSCLGREFTVTLLAQDTQAPAGTALAGETHCGYPLAAGELVTGLQDAGTVTVSYLQEPDWDTDGEQTAVLQLEDQAGNRTVLETVCTVIREDEPPVLWGVTNRVCYLDEAVAYLKGVYAEDNYDEPDAITITVDNSQVNLREAGKYKVTYTATDRSGNSTSKTVTFTFKEAAVNSAALDAALDVILGEILTDDMTTAEKARAIYDWIYDSISYADGSNHTDMLLAASKGLSKRTGDCYTYFSLSYLMLTKIGVDVIPVERSAKYSARHYWCLVNLGTGWYHFDPTNFNPSRIKAKSCFLKTTEELYAMKNGKYTWSFTASQYPTVATEPFTDPEKTE